MARRACVGVCMHLEGQVVKPCAHMLSSSHLALVAMKWDQCNHNTQVEVETLPVVHLFGPSCPDSFRRGAEFYTSHSFGWFVFVFGFRTSPTTVHVYKSLVPQFFLLFTRLYINIYRDLK